MPSNPTQHVSRPGGVTLLVVLGLIQGIASIAGGIFLVVDKDNAELLDKSAMSENQLFGSGIGLIIAARSWWFCPWRCATAAISSDGCSASS